MEKNNNTKKIVGGVILIVLIITFVVWRYSANSTAAINYTQDSSLATPNNNVVQNNNSISNTSDQGSKQLFSSSPLAQNAYLISTATYDANTKKALAGFTVTKKTLGDGSIQITLNAQNPNYQNQTYNVKDGEKLYFIEKNLLDDNDTGDKFTGDDQAILVDANGLIINN